MRIDHLRALGTVTGIPREREVRAGLASGLRQFPEGTIFFRELQLTRKGENPDGSRTEASERLFPRTIQRRGCNGQRVQRYSDTGGWGYYSFNHHEPKAMTASMSEGRMHLLPH